MVCTRCLLASADLDEAAATVTPAAARTRPLAWRRQAPFAALLATGVAGSMLGIGWPELNAVYIFIAVVVAVFSAGAYAEPRRAAVGCALVLLWFWAGALIDNAQHPGQRGPSDAVFVTVVFGGAWLLGRALRGRGLHAEQLAQRATQLEADQQAQARAAVAAERARIARELHDVIAHSVSVMVIHAGPAQAQVLVRYQDHAVELEVLDDGQGPEPGDGADGRSGHGLVGMRERVALYGGTLDAGPRATTTGAAETGYAVRARLPTDA